MSDAATARPLTGGVASSSYDEDLTKTTKERLAYYEALAQRSKESGPKQRSAT